MLPTVSSFDALYVKERLWDPHLRHYTVEVKASQNELKIHLTIGVAVLKVSTSCSS